MDINNAMTGMGTAAMPATAAAGDEGALLQDFLGLVQSFATRATELAQQQGQTSPQEVFGFLTEFFTALGGLLGGSAGGVGDGGDMDSGGDAGDMGDGMDAGGGMDGDMGPVDMPSPNPPAAGVLPDGVLPIEEDGVRGFADNMGGSLRIAFDENGEFTGIQTTARTVTPLEDGLEQVANARVNFDGQGNPLTGSSSVGIREAQVTGPGEPIGQVISYPSGLLVPVTNDQGQIVGFEEPGFAQGQGTRVEAFFQGLGDLAGFTVTERPGDGSLVESTYDLQGALIGRTAISAPPPPPPQPTTGTLPPGIQPVSGEGQIGFTTFNPAVQESTVRVLFDDAGNITGVQTIDEELADLPGNLRDVRRFFSQIEADGSNPDAVTGETQSVRPAFDPIGAPGPQPITVPANLVAVTDAAGQVVGFEEAGVAGGNGLRVEVDFAGGAPSGFTITEFARLDPAAAPFPGATQIVEGSVFDLRGNLIAQFAS